jgi:hypothetical protein
MVSLMSLLVMGIMKSGGIGNLTSKALADRTQSHLYALSGVNIAYHRLKDDLTYTGESHLSFGQKDGDIEIKVADCGNSVYEILSVGAVGNGETRIKTRAFCSQMTSAFPLAVGGIMSLEGKSHILGDCYVKGRFSGESKATIKGDVYLTGDRTTLFSYLGIPANIDGYDVPTITGTLNTGAPLIDLPAISMDELTSKYYYSATVLGGYVNVKNKYYKGVVYLDLCYEDPVLSNVVIDGVLIIKTARTLRITDGFLKVTCSQTTLPNIAIIGPDGEMNVPAASEIYVYGLTYMEHIRLAGKGSFTGPVIVWDTLETTVDSNIILQFPSDLTSKVYDNVIWDENYVVELEYQEL